VQTVESAEMDLEIVGRELAQLLTAAAAEPGGDLVVRTEPD